MAKRIAIVVPYCGPTVFGGASALALAVGRRLSYGFQVELLTTCATNYETWANELPEGYSEIDGVAVRRFRTERPRRRAHFDRLSRELMYNPAPQLEEQEQWMRAQGPDSPALFEYLETFGQRYDAVLFFSYLYATSYFGLPIVEDRAILVPLAHDEWPLKFPFWDRFFRRPRVFVYQSEEERALAAARFPFAATGGAIAGVGIEPPAGISAQRFRSRTGITEPFLLYVGRIDASKGCEELVDDFVRYRAAGGRVRRLVLAGELHLRIEQTDGVSVLGPLDEQTKWDALAACELFVMPSAYESLSIAMLEAWTQGRAVLVSGRSEALVGQCRRAQGGLWYTNADEFAVALDTLDAPTAAVLGAAGRRYVAQRYGWQQIDQIYYHAIDQIERLNA